MPSNATATIAENKADKEKSVSPAQSKALILLALWDLGVHKKTTLISTGDLPDRAKKPTNVFQQLVKEGAIATTKENRKTMVSLNLTGVEQLKEALGHINFEFAGTTVGAWLPVALLKWMQQNQGVVSVAATNGKPIESAIASYDAFKQVALEVYDRLNRDYNMHNLVPIYRIRREIGDRVSRVQFKEWLLELQENGIFLLRSGELLDATADKLEDSVTTELGELRYYAKLQNF